MPEFKFIEESHKYLLDGVEIPSVTTVLPYNYTGDTEQARLRGVYVHKAIELYNADNLDENSLDPALVPYLESYKKAERLNFDSIVIDYKTGSNHPCTALQLAGYVELARVNRKSLQDNPKHEIQLYHPTYRYAGTIDYVCLTSELDQKTKAFALYLQANGSAGKYEDHSKDLRKNTGLFLCFLATYKFRKENNL